MKMSMMKTLDHLCWGTIKITGSVQTGREIQGITRHKRQDSKEHRSEKGTFKKLAAWTQCHHAGINTSLLLRINHIVTLFSHFLFKKLGNTI